MRAVGSLAAYVLFTVAVAAVLASILPVLLLPYLVVAVVGGVIFLAGQRPAATSKPKACLPGWRRLSPSTRTGGSRSSGRFFSGSSGAPRGRRPIDQPMASPDHPNRLVAPSVTPGIEK